MKCTAFTVFKKMYSFVSVFEIHNQNITKHIDFDSLLHVNVTGAFKRKHSLSKRFKSIIHNQNITKHIALI